MWDFWVILGDRRERIYRRYEFGIWPKTKTVKGEVRP
jgi:hypothetical protein